jgi:hypothetical protein
MAGTLTTDKAAKTYGISCFMSVWTVPWGSGLLVWNTLMEAANK